MTARPLRLRLRLPEPYDLGWIFRFLAGRATPALERVEPGTLVRVVRLAGVPLVLTVRPAPDPAAPRWLAVEAVPTATAAAPAVRLLVRRMLDLDTDLAPFLAMARRDPVLRPLVARHPGLRLPQLPDPFEGAVRAIVGQQVSVAAARTVVDRLIRRLGEPVAAAAGSFFAFPHPAAMAAAPAELLAGLGLTRAKATALIAVAAASRDGTLDWERLRGAPPEAAHQVLLALPGIGPWTASYIRMRALGDCDAFPASDLGVVKALAALGLLAPAGRLAAAEISALAERWRPFRAYAAIHLWRSLSP
ncbi:MAG: DNA-3-methyladenine glycosylase 2 family protein [Acidobacteria bacterium]|nr:DNA-3-methyladenine glycosylase 2 family protein [Acidobacteriota bacterium]